MRWWQIEDEDALAKQLCADANELQKLQQVRLQNAWFHHRLYGGLNPQSLVGFTVLGHVDPTPISELLVPRFPLNIIKSTIDTVGSQLAEQDIKASFQTEGGSYDQQRKAKLLEQFTDGCFYGSDWYSKAPQVLLDADIYGTGVARIYMHKGRPCADRIFPFEILIDDVDGREGKPSQLIHRRLATKDSLKALYPDKEELIESAQTVRIRLLNSAMSAEVVEVFEAWHLPSSSDSDDGCRAVVCDRGALVVEPWTRDDFPFVVLRGLTGHAQIGWWGTGMAEVLASLQGMVNDECVALQEAASAATYKWLIERGSDIARAQLNNRIGGALEYTRTKPDMVESPDVENRFINFINWAVGQAYQLVGVSQMAAQSMKPAGLDSGAALREFADVQTQRFALLSKAYAQLHVDAAKAFIRAARQASADGDITVSSPGARFLKRIKWSEINLDEDLYVVQPWPANLLPKTPAARIQYVQELMRAQMITPKQGLKLLRMPDVVDMLGMETANEEYASWLICKLLDGEMVQPDPLTDLPMVAAEVQKAYAKAVTEMEENDERLNLLRSFLQITSAKLPQPDAQPPGPEATPSPAPQGRPMPPPVSEMLPQGGSQ